MQTRERTAVLPSDDSITARSTDRFKEVGNFTLAVPALLVVIGVVAIPLGLTIVQAFVPGSEGSPWSWIAENPVYIQMLGQTFFTAGTTVVACLALGYPYAYLMTLVGPRWRASLLIIALVPFWVSGLVRIFAWVILLQSGGPVSVMLPFLGGEGILRTPLAVQIGLVQVLLPFLILPLYNSLRTIDPRLMLAAESLGARRVVGFWRIIAPLSAAGAGAGSLIVFILTLGFYVLPQMLGSPSTAMIGNAIFTQASSLGNYSRAAALAVLLIGSSLILIALVLLIVAALRKVAVR